jgi:hypothetical protein
MFRKLITPRKKNEIVPRHVCWDQGMSFNEKKLDYKSSLIVHLKELSHETALAKPAESSTPLILRKPY